MSTTGLSSELNQLTELYTDLIGIAELLRKQGDHINHASVLEVASGLQNLQLNVVTEMVNQRIHQKNKPKS